MTRPRKELISLSDTPYYHIVSRCVRRSFLCGFDNHTQQDYEHRKQWIVDRIRLLSSLFAIDLCSYAIMSNHYHLVVRIDPTQAQSWSDKDVARRWTTIYRGPLLIQQWLAGNPLSKTQSQTIHSIINIWRERLCNISWFMKCLNEPIARLANKEDGCTGHFWESRYKSQALLTDDALLTCMVYVDLNPIRAGIHSTPESSDYTSIQERISPKWNLTTASNNQLDDMSIDSNYITIKPLSEFKAEQHNALENQLPITLIDYIKLVDWTGRIIRDDKKGAIPEHIPPVAERLNSKSGQWLQNSQQFEDIYQRRFMKKRRINSS